MNFLPIAHLEMKAAARNPMTYYARCLTALITISAGIGFLFAGFIRLISASSAGQSVFCMMASCAYVLLAMQAILLTCDCISREKREDTLGLLFLTDLTGFDIVAGKLAAQSGRSLSCLVAAFPAFGFCIILGGVSLGDFVEVAFALLNTLFYFAALGIFISTSVWRERTAAAWGGMALLIIGAMLPVLAVICNLPAWASLIPAGAIMAALASSTGVTSPPNAIMWMLISHAMGWLFIVAASLRLPRSMTQPPKTISSRRRDASAPWMTPLAKPLMTTAILAMICAVVLDAALFGPPWIGPTAIATTILLLHGVLKFQMATQAGRVLADKRRTGELELLLTTPYDEDEILRACLLGLKRSLFWPTVFALGIDFALLIFVGWKTGFGEVLMWSLACMAMEIIWLLLNLYGLSWVGLYLGLRLANPAKAAGRAIFCVVLLPWLAVIFTGLAGMMLTHNQHLSEELIVPSAIFFLTAIVVCNTLFPGLAINALRDQFRAWAARP